MIPWWKQLPWNLIAEKAAFFHLPENLIAAIIQQESAAKSCATRFEANYKWTTRNHHFAGMNSISAITEEIQQKTSWGLMQVMGGTARDLGYEGPLVKLCEPGTGIHWGCSYLARIYKQYGILEDVISAYNAGSPRRDTSGVYLNNRYVIEVMTKMKEIKF